MTRDEKEFVDSGAPESLSAPESSGMPELSSVEAASPAAGVLRSIVGGASPLAGWRALTGRAISKEWFAVVPRAAQLCIACLSPSGDIQTSAKPVGTRVARGELLLKSDTAQPHLPIAPRAGVIGGVSNIELTEQTQTPAIVLDVDEPAVDDETPSLRGAPTEALGELSSRLKRAGLGGWIDLFRLAGIWADRWASPDLIGQLHLSLRRPVDTVVCSVLDEDAAVPLQGRVLATWPTEVVAGLAALSALCSAGRTWLVVPQELGGAGLMNLRQACNAANATLIPLPNPYPQSHPSLLVHELTARHLAAGHLPVEQGVLLLDAAAAAAVGKYILRDEPMLTLPLGLYDMVERRARFVVADIGMSVRDLLRLAKMDESRTIFRAGAPLRDVRICSDTVVHGGELTIYTSPDAADINPDPCIRCAWCVEACPVRIQPAGLLEAAQRRDLKLAEAYGLSSCIKCGICSYVCPSRLPLLRGIRTLG